MKNENKIVKYLALYAKRNNPKRNFCKRDAAERNFVNVIAQVLLFYSAVSTLIGHVASCSVGGGRELRNDLARSAALTTLSSHSNHALSLFIVYFF